YTRQGITDGAILGSSHVLFRRHQFTMQLKRFAHHGETTLNSMCRTFRDARVNAIRNTRNHASRMDVRIWQACLERIGAGIFLYRLESKAKAFITRQPPSFEYPSKLLRRPLLPKTVFSENGR